MEALVLTHPAGFVSRPRRDLLCLRQDVCASGETCYAFGISVVPPTIIVAPSASCLGLWWYLYAANETFTLTLAGPNTSTIGSLTSWAKLKPKTKSKTILQFRILARSLFWNWSRMIMLCFVFLLQCTRCAPGICTSSGRPTARNQRAQAEINTAWRNVLDNCQDQDLKTCVSV